ncbi:hypothetical protein [Clostridium sp. LIBA-8841]|uniref:hypothetical protein n=1 Tax=Clostridium sp. LIBA-8841 TaxID=2987530 RepID=UPI002AC6ABE3|nr:hypothetical protein [Clostridium sp. LIBA-8841]MDZ5252980.1 hypothetical protein [Clostridium sp. LIBA-8841]
MSKKKNKFLSLLQYEASRNFKVIALNVLITMVITIALYYIESLAVVGSYENNVLFQGVIYDMAIRPLGMNRGKTYIFFLEILLIIIFSIFIWAREFYSENKTIYRSLSLPIKKCNLILSKSLVVLLFFGMFLLGQFLSIIINWLMLKIKLGSNFNIELNVLTEALFNNISYGFISMDMVNLTVMIIFIFLISLIGALAVFLKQSFGIKGIVYWIIYVIITIFIFFYVPVTKLHLFAIEFLLLYTIGLLIYIGITFMLNNYLINKKINV